MAHGPGTCLQQVFQLRGTMQSVVGLLPLCPSSASTLRLHRCPSTALSCRGCRAMPYDCSHCSNQAATTTAASHMCLHQWHQVASSDWSQVTCPGRPVCWRQKRHLLQPGHHSALSPGCTTGSGSPHTQFCAASVCLCPAVRGLAPGRCTCRQAHAAHCAAWRLSLPPAVSVWSTPVRLLHSPCHGGRPPSHPSQPCCCCCCRW
jgi:hypothetical protein